MNVEQQSFQSLYIQPCLGDRLLATGTAFTVERQGRAYLITNRHNVTGRNSANQPLGEFSQMPDNLIVWQNERGRLGSWISVAEPLYSQPGAPRWFEHPTFGRRVDVVALPLTSLSNVQLYPYETQGSMPEQISTRVSSDLSIIGFPFGLTGGGALGIWSRGTVATEPEIDFDNLPLFLIDSRTRKGQSGSPVVFHSVSGTVSLKDGGTSMFAGSVTFLLGVYSGRINAESDLGLVWKVRVINEIIDAAVCPSGDSLMPE